MPKDVDCYLIIHGWTNILTGTAIWQETTWFIKLHISIVSLMEDSIYVFEYHYIGWWNCLRVMDDKWNESS
jgi:uncharacterized membrane protein